MPDRAEPTKANIPPLERPIKCIGANAQALKRTAEDAFGATVDSASKKVQSERAAKLARLGVFTRILNGAGESCGACFFMKLRGDHNPMDCPLEVVQDDRSSLTVPDTVHKFKTRLKYPKNLLCFKCHINSYGKDLLHIPYGSGPCENPHLMLGLYAIIWISPKFWEQFTAELKKDFDRNFDQFVTWLQGHNHIHKTNSMWLLAWASTNMESRE